MGAAAIRTPTVGVPRVLSVVCACVEKKNSAIAWSATMAPRQLRLELNGADRYARGQGLQASPR
eukprot:scaffold1548_cov117-Isochrysis_galbana.AAC.9